MDTVNLDPFTVAPAEAGHTLAKVLRSRLHTTQPSWAQIRSLIEARRVQVGDSVCSDSARRLKEGESVTVLTRPSKLPGTATDRTLVVRHLDDHVIVVEKPTGINSVRHPLELTWKRSRRRLDPTLQDLAQGAVAARHRAGGRFPPLRIVQRLDKDTSGLLVFARSALAERELGLQFRKHTVVRRYLALVPGHILPRTFQSRLVRDRGDGYRGSTTLPDIGKFAVTHVEVAERLAGYTLLSCRLETGRTHQIRIHLSEAGHPVCGDKVYHRKPTGEPIPDESGAPRLFLHAAELGFEHPVLKTNMHWEMPLPADLDRFLQTLRYPEVNPMPTPIDLRSDTVTVPTDAMRAAMFAASVGDDVYGEDPAVNELEAKVADYFGKEAAVFVPSGTMGNQIAIRVHTRPGDEMLIESDSHIVVWEAGGQAVLSGVSARTIDGEYGILTPERLDGMVRPDDIYSVRTRLVCLENTHNRGGGTIYPIDTVRAVCSWAAGHGLARHLDAARIWNAIAETGVPGRDWAEPFDTLSVCFSKGLGAPVGSAIVGPRDLMKQARKARKLFGGAMRQAGFLAAACTYAIDHHVDRLKDDHANARLIGEAVADTPGLTLTPNRVETNLVWCEVAPEIGTARAVAARLRDHGVLVAPLGERTIRVVTHLNVDRADCERAADLIRRHARG